LQVNDNLTTVVDTPCQLEFAGPVNSTLHEVDIDTTKKSTHPSGSSRTPAKTKKPEAPGDSRVKELIDYFCEKYLAAFGHKYSVSGARDGKQFKDLLKDHTPETIRRCVDLFFEDSDSWLDGKRTIGVFRSRINQYNQQLNSLRKPSRQPGPELPDLSDYRY